MVKWAERYKQRDGDYVVASTKPINFKKTDGYADYAALAFKMIFRDITDPEILMYGAKFCNILKNLRDENVNIENYRINGEIDFNTYREKISSLLVQVSNVIDANIFAGNKASAIADLMENKYTNMFLFVSEADENKSFADQEKETILDIRDQLNRLQIETNCGMKYFDISSFMTDTGYHIQVTYAVNYALNGLVYLSNCSSFIDNHLYEFDRYEIEMRMKMAILAVERIAGMAEHKQKPEEEIER